MGSLVASRSVFDLLCSRVWSCICGHCVRSFVLVIIRTRSCCFLLTRVSSLSHTVSPFIPALTPGHLVCPNTLHSERLHRPEHRHLCEPICKGPCWPGRRLLHHTTHQDHIHYRRPLRSDRVHQNRGKLDLLFPCNWPLVGVVSFGHWWVWSHSATGGCGWHGWQETQCLGLWVWMCAQNIGYLLFGENWLNMCIWWHFPKPYMYW